MERLSCTPLWRTVLLFLGPGLFLWTDLAVETGGNTWMVRHVRCANRNGNCDLEFVEAVERGEAPRYPLPNVVPGTWNCGNPFTSLWFFKVFRPSPLLQCHMVRLFIFPVDRVQPKNASGIGQKGVQQFGRDMYHINGLLPGIHCLDNAFHGGKSAHFLGAITPHPD